MTGRIEEQVTDSRGRVTRYDYDAITEEANSLVIGGDRQKAYGHPLPWAKKVAAMWHAAFGWDVKPWQVAVAMILFKICRQCNKHHRDNLVDIAGYAEVANRVIEAEAQLSRLEAELYHIGPNDDDQ